MIHDKSPEIYAHAVQTRFAHFLRTKPNTQTHHFLISYIHCEEITSDRYWIPIDDVRQVRCCQRLNRFKVSLRLLYQFSGPFLLHSIQPNIQQVQRSFHQSCMLHNSCVISICVVAAAIVAGAKRVCFYDCLCSLCGMVKWSSHVVAGMHGTVGTDG